MMMYGVVTVTVTMTGTGVRVNVSEREIGLIEGENEGIMVIGFVGVGRSTVGATDGKRGGQGIRAVQKGQRQQRCPSSRWRGGGTWLQCFGSLYPPCYHSFESSQHRNHVGTYVRTAISKGLRIGCHLNLPS